MSKQVKALKTRFVPPYKKNENGNYRVNIPFLDSSKKQSGVYFIKSTETGKLIYIGFSYGSLYKTITRHFQIWEDRVRTYPRFTYNRKSGYTVRVIFTTPARAALLEKYLIIKLQPRDNSHKYENYMTQYQSNSAEAIINETDTYSGKDEDFPF